jgi:cytochrome P450
MSTSDIEMATWRPVYAEDPHPFFADSGLPAPVSRGTLDGLPVWLVTGYDDVRRLLADERVSSELRNASPAARAVPWMQADSSSLVAAQSLVRLDNPEHARVRKLVAKAFTARRVEALRPRVQQITDHLIQTMLPRGHVDLISDFALPLPLAVISELLGIPEDGRQDFLRWSNIYMGVDEGDVGRRAEALSRISDYVSALIADKSARRGGGAADGSLLDGLIAVRDEGDRLSHDELLSLAFLLPVAGYETTANLIANGILGLLHHPDQLAALRADPARIGPAIEELLRYDTPVKMPALRFTTAEVQVADTVIPAGEAVVLFLSATNRDPDRFPAAGDLDVGRDASGHLAFGHGAHFCLGAPLARLEAKIAFTALLTRLDGLALGPGAPAWRHTFQLHSLKTLPVTFTPVPGGAETSP